MGLVFGYWQAFSVWGTSSRIESSLPGYNVERDERTRAALLKLEKLVLAFLYLEAKCNVIFIHTQSWGPLKNHWILMGKHSRTELLFCSDGENRTGRAVSQTAAVCVVTHSPHKESEGESYPPGQPSRNLQKLLQHLLFISLSHFFTWFNPEVFLTDMENSTGSKGRPTFFLPV